MFLKNLVDFKIEKCLCLVEKLMYFEMYSKKIKNISSKKFDFL